MKKVISLIFLLITLFSFSQNEEAIPIKRNWICTEAVLNTSDYDPRKEKYLALFKDSEFCFENNNDFKLKKVNPKNKEASQTLIDSYWKFNKKNEILIDYNNPSSVLKIELTIKNKELYFLLFNKAIALKMKKLN